MGLAALADCHGLTFMWLCWWSGFSWLVVWSCRDSVCAAVHR